MRICYFCNRRYLSLHFMRGWQRAFQALGHEFVHLEPDQPDLRQVFAQEPFDWIMAFSQEGLTQLPLDLINQANSWLIVGALPANGAGLSFDPQTPLMMPQELHFLAQAKHPLAWSQHQPWFNQNFYQTYQELGIPLVFLPHAADITQIKPLAPNPVATWDLVFVGSLAHRIKGNRAWFGQFSAIAPPHRMKIFGDSAWRKHYGLEAGFTPADLDWDQLFSQAALAPNIHSQRQREHLVLLNDRSFHLPALGAFQLCDNPLLQAFFKTDEVVFCETPQDFTEKAQHFLQHPDARADWIKKARARVCQDHSYFNRIASLLQATGQEAKVQWQGQDFAPFVPFADLPARAPASLAFYRLESRFYQTGRKVKAWLKPPK